MPRQAAVELVNREQIGRHPLLRVILRPGRSIVIDAQHPETGRMDGGGRTIPAAVEAEFAASRIDRSPADPVAQKAGARPAAELGDEAVTGLPRITGRRVVAAGPADMRIEIERGIRRNPPCRRVRQHREGACARRGLEKVMAVRQRFERKRSISGRPFALRDDLPLPVLNRVRFRARRVVDKTEGQRFAIRERSARSIRAELHLRIEFGGGQRPGKQQQAR